MWRQFRADTHGKLRPDPAPEADPVLGDGADRSTASGLAPAARGKHDDLIVVQLSGATGLKRGDIVVFNAPRSAAMECGEGGTLVKRVIGLGGETVHEDKGGFIDIDGKRLTEPYI